MQTKSLQTTLSPLPIRHSPLPDLDCELAIQQYNSGKQTTCSLKLQWQGKFLNTAPVYHVSLIA